MFLFRLRQRPLVPDRTALYRRRVTFRCSAVPPTHRLLLAGVFLAWAAGALAQPPVSPRFDLASDDPPLAHLRLVPVGAGVALLVADPTSTDDDVIAGSALIGGGFLVGPSLGHVHLGDWRRALIGLGIRGGGIALGTAVGAAAHGGDDDWFGGITEFAPVSLAGYAAGTAYSLATINRSAREHSLVAVPLVRPDGTPVLALAARL